LTPAPVPDDQSLEQPSTEELHELAVRQAVTRRDLSFFWNLIELLPAAEAAAGRLDKAVADVLTLRAHVDDLTDSGRGEIAELLRPYYLDYLRRAHVRAPAS
jgi:hypothetical protein